MPQYSVYKDEVFDAPIKTQVSVKVLVSPTDSSLSDASLRGLMKTLYASVMSRKGFQYHDAPTNVYIYACTTKRRANGPQIEYLAMLEKNWGDTSPTIDIDTLQLASLRIPAKEVFGLSETEREQIWAEQFACERRAQQIAHYVYPNMVPLSAENEKWSDLQQKLKKDFEEKLAKKHGLTKGQLSDIATEGMLKRWPMPKRKELSAEELARVSSPFLVTREVPGDKLIAGRRYRIYAEFNLMPMHTNDFARLDPKQLGLVWKRIRKIEKERTGLACRVVEVRASRQGTPWYKIRYGQTQGWVNSVALMSAKIEDLSR